MADTIAKDEALKSLLALLTTMALTVNLQASGNKGKLESSGFTLAAVPGKIGVLAKPEGFKIKSGDNSGDVLLQVKPNPNADIYLFYSAPVPAPTSMENWRTIPSKKSKTNVSGYTPGKEYAFRCAYKGSEDTLIYSDIITMFVQ